MEVVLNDELFSLEDKTKFAYTLYSAYKIFETAFTAKHRNRILNVYSSLEQVIGNREESTIGSILWYIQGVENGIGSLSVSSAESIQKLSNAADKYTAPSILSVDGQAVADFIDINSIEADLVSYISSTLSLTVSQKRDLSNFLGSKLSGMISALKMDILNVYRPSESASTIESSIRLSISEEFRAHITDLLAAYLETHGYGSQDIANARGKCDQIISALVGGQNYWIIPNLHRQFFSEMNAFYLLIEKMTAKGGSNKFLQSRDSIFGKIINRIIGYMVFPEGQGEDSYKGIFGKNTRGGFEGITDGEYKALALFGERLYNLLTFFVPSNQKAAYFTGLLQANFAGNILSEGRFSNKVDGLYLPLFNIDFTNLESCFLIPFDYKESVRLQYLNAPDSENLINQNLKRYLLAYGDEYQRIGSVFGESSFRILGSNFVNGFFYSLGRVTSENAFLANLTDSDTVPFRVIGRNGYEQLNSRSKYVERNGRMQLGAGFAFAGGDNVGISLGSSILLGISQYTPYAAQVAGVEVGSPKSVIPDHTDILKSGTRYIPTFTEVCDNARFDYIMSKYYDAISAKARTDAIFLGTVWDPNNWAKFLCPDYVVHGEFWHSNYGYDDPFLFRGKYNLFSTCARSIWL